MLKVLELFSGIGHTRQALKNIGIEHTSTQCEIDKYAINTYNQLHGNTENLGDISRIKEDDLHKDQWDLVVYSFPCQSVSLAGKQEGLVKGSGTESSLLWECEKVIRKVRPKYLLMENVDALVSDKFMPYFQQWLNLLEDYGYTNYWQVLNAKNYGIPQNRARVFCVSFLGKHHRYTFPTPIPLKLKLKDMLEDKVEDRYYIKQTIADKFFQKINEKEISNSIRVGGAGSLDRHSWDIVACAMRGRQTQTGTTEQQIEMNTADTANCITTVQKDSMVVEQEVMQVGNLYPSPTRDNPNQGRVYDSKGIAPTINTCQGGNLQPHVVEPLNTETDGTAHTIKSQYAKTSKANFERQGTFAATGVIEREPKVQFVGGINGDEREGYRVNDANAIAATVKAQNTCHTWYKIDQVQESTVVPKYRIRKLTVREVFRLMGWKDSEFDKIKGISNAQLYKQAGNGIVIQVLEAIFKQMFYDNTGDLIDQQKTYKQMDLF